MKVTEQYLGIEKLKITYH